MVAIPRIITVDPTGNIAQQVRSAVELIDRLIIQVDVPNGTEAIAELKRGGCQAVIATWSAGDNMPGWELAAEVRKAAPDAAVLIIADYDDTELDAETRAESPFAYFQRPFDAEQFMRTLRAAIDGEDIFAAMNPPETPTATGAVQEDLGPVPQMNVARAEDIVQGLLTDLNAIAILMVDRNGEVLLERGALGFLNRDDLARSIIPTITTTLKLRDLIGGNLSGLQFYDGDEYDIYVLTVGLHHYLIMLYDGKKGSRELGNVRIFGRRAAEDLIALVGAQAWMIMRPASAPEEQEKREPARPARTRPKRRDDDDDLDLLELDRATFTASQAEPEPEPVAESKPIMEAIDDDAFDPDLLFGDDSGFDDDLFSLDKMEELAKEQTENRAGIIDDEEARRLGLIK